MFKKNTSSKSIYLPVLLLSLTALRSFGQSACDIGDHYDDFIQIQRASFDGEYHFAATIKEVDSESCVSGLMNHNRLFMDYLVTNYSLPIDQEKLRRVSDSLMWKRTYVADLRRDTSFDKLMTEWVAKTGEEELPKDTVTKDELLNLAVKFFEIKSINEKGLYVGRICVAANEVEATESERRPFLEAFCFSSIFKHLQGEPFNLHDEYIDAIRELYKMNLGDKNEEKLLRAQGALFVLMRTNERLRLMFESEYEKNKKYLPFVLIEKRLPPDEEAH